MTRVFAAAVLLGLVVAGTALAARGDPQRQINAADQARAKAMLVQRTDLTAGFRTERSSGSSSDSDFYCKALDESDLTLTGDASSPDFKKPGLQVSSSAEVFASVADATASWRRGTSAAGVRCLRNAFVQAFRKQGGTVRSFKSVPFPPVGQRSAAFRLVTRTKGVMVFIDFVVMQHSRAHVSVGFVTGAAPVSKVQQALLAGVLARRAAKTMRGA